MNNYKIPILTYYSPSHERMFEDYFYPSYKEHLEQDFDLYVLKGEQKCSAHFEEVGWNQQVKEKINFVNKFIQTTHSKLVVFSDVDIIFFKNIRKELISELGSYDIALQNDSLNGELHNLCTGFYICQVNEIIKEFFEALIDNYIDELSDQQNMNWLLQNCNIGYKALSHRFFNFSHTNGKTWQSGSPVPFPKFPIVMYHANYTVGTSNKESLLKAFIDWDNKH